MHAPCTERLSGRVQGILLYNDCLDRLHGVNTENRGVLVRQIPEVEVVVFRASSLDISIYIIPPFT